MKRNGTIERLSLLITAAALVASCSSSQATSGPSGSSGAPSHGGTLSIAFQGDIQSLDPAIAYDTESWAMQQLLFSTLVTFDRNAKLVPELAESMPTVSADGKTYTFTLRKGVNFVKSDGSVLREMTADDVVYSLNRVLDPNLTPNPSPVATSFFGNIVGAADVIAGKVTAASGIKALDANTVEIDVVQPDRTLLDVLADPFGGIVPKEYAKVDSAAFSAAPIGTGPFYLKSYTKGQEAVFVRNPHYWQTGLPYLDEIDVHVGVDANSQLQQVEAGTLDITGDPFPSGSFTSVVNDARYKDRIVHQTLVSVLYIWMDTQSPNTPLKDVKVRQAVNYAINKENILKIVHNAGVVANCIFPSSMPGGYDPNCKPYTYDVAKAKQLMADAGYPNGFSTTFYTDTADPDPQIAQAIQQDLAAINIKVNVVTQEWATFLTTVETPHAAPMGYVSWYQDYPDPSDFVDPILSCATAVKGGSNFALYCNKSVDANAAAAKGEQDATKRTAEYQAIQNQIMADAPWVPIWHQEWYTLLSPRVQTFYLHPVWYYDLGNYSVSGG